MRETILSKEPFLVLSRKHHGEASVAVLFSGGIDSAVLAFLADGWVMSPVLICEIVHVAQVHTGGRTHRPIERRVRKPAEAGKKP